MRREMFLHDLRRPAPEIDRRVFGCRFGTGPRNLDSRAHYERHARVFDFAVAGPTVGHDAAGSGYGRPYLFLLVVVLILRKLGNCTRRLYNWKDLHAENLG